MRIAHLSDLHFGHHDLRLADGLAEDVTAQVPNLVVISGDFTQRGTAAEFELARRFVRLITAPVFAVPGNHDIPERDVVGRLVHPYKLYRRYICSDLDPFVEMDGVAIAGLKTSRRARFEMDWSNGTISRSQLGRLAARFGTASATAVRIVVAHHPLLIPDIETAFVRQPVRRASLALAALRELEVRLVLSGHFHLSYVRKYEGQNEGAAFPSGRRRSTGPPLLLVQAGSTISTRLKGEPNAYNLIDIEGANVTVTVREHVGDAWTTRQEIVARS